MFVFHCEIRKHFSAGHPFSGQFRGQEIIENIFSRWTLLAISFVAIFVSCFECLRFSTVRILSKIRRDGELKVNIFSMERLIIDECHLMISTVDGGYLNPQLDSNGMVCISFAHSSHLYPASYRRIPSNYLFMRLRGGFFRKKCETGRWIVDWSAWFHRTDEYENLCEYFMRSFVFSAREILGIRHREEKIVAIEKVREHARSCGEEEHSHRGFGTWIYWLSISCFNAKLGNYLYFARHSTSVH